MVDLPSATSIAQGLLDKVKDWCWSNGMALNSQKSAIVNFRTPYRMSDVREPITLTFGNDIIPQATMVKFLGVYLDCFLSFKPHITHTRSLILRQSSMLHRINSFLPPDIMVSLYHAFIHLTFLIAALSGAILINLFSAHFKEPKIGQ